MARTLVIGYGNVDRQDDGVAFHVLNAARLRLGRPPLAEDDTGLEDLGHPVDTIFLLQLGPELLDVAAEYERLILVDAHVQAGVEDVRWERVVPEYAPSAFTHHMTPAMFMALLQALYQRRPEVHVVSIRGHHFDFQRNLTASTAALVEPAADQVLHLIAGPEGV